VNEALSALEREFAALYSPIGRPSIPPEKLLRAMLLQAFYSIRSERLLMERLEYDLLFRWFVGIIEGSNRSRVTDLAASAARDLFEPGLNEAASWGPRPMGVRSTRRRRDVTRCLPCGRGWLQVVSDIGSKRCHRR